MLRLVSITLAVAILLPTAAPGQDSPSVTNADKRAILDAFATRISETYTFPDRAPDVIAALRTALEDGRFDQATNAQMFASELTGFLRATFDDRHFAVLHDPARYERTGAMGGANPALRMFDGPPDQAPNMASPAMRQIAERMRRAGYYLPRLEVLRGNVGYLRLEQMPLLEIARSTVDGAMQYLASTDALVIDLRDAPGGVGGFIPYLMSYLFPDEGMLLFEREFAWADTTEQFRTTAVPGNERLSQLPLYVLTNGRTGSAAENLAYTLQQHGRAAVVGESTTGGAHSSTMVQLTDGFVAQLPIARVVHPVSNSNWQGDGVQPDTAVPASIALETAHAAALETIAQTTDDPAWRSDSRDLGRWGRGPAPPPAQDPHAAPRKRHLEMGHGPAGWHGRGRRPVPTRGPAAGDPHPSARGQAA